MEDFTNYWKIRWAQAGILDDVIDRFAERYGTPPEWLTVGICADDNRMGAGEFSIDYTNEEIRRHDKEMFLAEHGFPITTNIETQETFLEDNVEKAAVGALWAVIGVPVGVVGATVGYVIGVTHHWW